MNDRPTVEELEHVYSSLLADDRDQLLQELPVAAAHGAVCPTEKAVGVRHGGCPPVTVE